MIQFDRKHQEIIFPVALVKMIYKIAKEGHHQIYNFQYCPLPVQTMAYLVRTKK